MTTRLQKAKVGRRSTLVLHRTASKKGHNGFEDLKDYIKTGEDYCKEVSAVLQERAELEATYSRGLFKVASKLLKASKECSGTVPNAWYFVANDFEQSAEIHKTIAGILLEEIAKPLKSFVDGQYKARKSLEAIVEKRNKQFVEWKATQAKAKARSYLSCKDNEKVQDQMLDCKLGRGRQLSDKENLKLDTKRKKSETGVRKSDMEYYASCIKTERSRLDWEGSIVRGSQTMRRLEDERLSQLAGKAKQYLTVMEEYRPKLKTMTDQLVEPVSLCDVRKDIAGLGRQEEVEQEGMGEQVLPTFYCEDLVNVMNRERRREALAKFVGIVKADIERERKGRAGVENLAKALQETPKFGGEESQQDVQEKLGHMKAMLTYLEATRFKLLNTMMDLEGRPRVSHPMASYMDHAKDKQGFAQTTLRIPNWVVSEAPQINLDIEPDWSDRGTADGGVEAWSSSPLNRSPHLQTAIGLGGDSSPVFTTTNPILFNRQAEFMSRGTADGGLEDEGRGSTPRSHPSPLAYSPSYHGHSNGHSGSSVAGHSHTATEEEEEEDNLPDSDFDDFDDSEEGGQEYLQHPHHPQQQQEHQQNHHHQRRGSRNSVGVNDNIHENEDEDDDELSEPTPNSQDNEIHEIYYQEKQVAVIGQCRAVYDYTANMYDELTIRYGDIINIHDKQEDDWWLGECDGRIGIFPATYVELV